VSTIIGCIPVVHCPNKPTDQSEPITQEPCPEFGDAMWVSAKKRELRATGIECKCMTCIIRADMQDGTLREMVDIGTPT